MDRQDMENIVNYIRLEAKVKTDMINNGMKGAAFYFDMDKDFLDLIKWLTGTPNGISMTDKLTLFIINADEGNEGLPVVSFCIAFDKTHGDYSHIENIIYKMDGMNEEHSGWNLTADKSGKVSNQIAKRLEAFVKRANDTNLFEYIWDISRDMYGNP